MNEKADFAVIVLKQYAIENQIPARSTSDLSPMEQWLILRLLAVTKNEVAVCDCVSRVGSYFENGNGIRKCKSCKKPIQ